MARLLDGFLALSQQKDHGLFAVGVQHGRFLLVLGLNSGEGDAQALQFCEDSCYEELAVVLFEASAVLSGEEIGKFISSFHVNEVDHVFVAGEKVAPRKSPALKPAIRLRDCLLLCPVVALEEILL